MVERQMKSPTRRTIVPQGSDEFPERQDQRMTAQSARFERAGAQSARFERVGTASSQVSEGPKDDQNNSTQNNNHEEAKANESPQNQERLADYFAIVGLPDDLKPIDNGCEPIRTIDKVEIVIMERYEVSEIKKQLHQQRSKRQQVNGVDISQQTLEELLLKQEQLEAQMLKPYEVPRHDPDREQWIDLDGTKNFYLHLTFGSTSPITDINFYYIAQKHENKLAVPAKENMHLVPVRRWDNEGPEVKYHTVLQKGSTEEKNALVFHGVYDMKYYLDRQELTNFPKTGLSSPLQPNKALCCAIKRQKKLESPIYDVNIIQGEGEKKLKTYSLLEGIKIVTYRLGLKKDRLLSFMKIDLLKNRFTPKILDRYPPEDRPEQPLHESIAQFCFPSGIQLHRSHMNPQSFHFILTGAEGQRNYGTVLFFDEQCPRGLKRKLKVAKYDDFHNIWTQKAICIMSRFSFFDSFKQVLNKLYQVHLSQNMHIPIERFVVNIMDEVPLPDLGNNMVAYEESINFYRPIDQYPPYVDTAAIQNLFKTLDVAGVIELFAQIALERKILFVSQHKTLLTQVAVALSSFIFPLSWNHTLIPILPISMINVIDAPFPFLIGVQAHILNEALANQVIEMPQHVTIVNLDGPDINTTESSVASSKFPAREFKVLKEKLMKATSCVGERPHSDLDMIDDAFMRIMVDPDEEDNQIDALGVRDAFLEFMSRIMENYKRYIKDPGMSAGQPVNDHAQSRDFFNYEKFRADKDASRPQAFIHKLTQTANFSYFIESRSVGRSVNDEQIIYFDHIVKMKRTAKKPTLLEHFEPKKTIRAEAPSEVDLVPDVKYMYEVFPASLDKSLYYTPRKLHYYRSDEQRSVHKQVLQKNQIKAMNEADWARYMAEVIYCMWFHVFASTLPMYSLHSSELIFFARKLLQYVTKKLHPLQEVEIVYRRMFEACGSCQQQEQVKQLYTELQQLRHIDPDKITFGTYYQSLLLCQRDKNEPGALSTDRKSNYIQFSDIEEIENRRNQEEAKDQLEQQASANAADQNNTAFRNEDDFDDLFEKHESAGGDTVSLQPQEKVIKLSQVLEGSLYIELQKECQSCENTIREEELFSLFTQDQSDYTVKCPHCSQCFVPKFLVQSEYKTPYINGREGLSMHLLPPCALYKEFINTLAKKGDQVLTQDVFINEHSVVFWNLMIYFRIMKLPCFFLDQDYSAKHARVQVSWIKKYLPSKILASSSTSKQNTRSSFGSKTRLDHDKLQKLDRQVEKSPARNSSITRVVSGITAGIGNLIKRSSSKGPSSKCSDGAPPTGKNLNSISKANVVVGASTDQSSSAYGMGITPSSALKWSPSLQLSDMKNKIKAGSVRSGSGPGSIIGSTTSDLERLERLMKQAKHAKKSIVRMFGKNLEEFRREMQYSKEIINSDMLSQDIPESMIRHAENFNKTDRSNEPFKKMNSLISMENLRIEEPEARSSNASTGGRAAINSSVPSQLYKLQKQTSLASNKAPVAGNDRLDQIDEDMGSLPSNFMADPNNKTRPPLPSMMQQPGDASPLANFRDMEMERSRSAQQPQGDVEMRQESPDIQGRYNRE